MPESQNFGYDSYAGLDVKDKIVLVLHYFPEDTDAKTKAALARYSDLRYKALAARQRGAKGLLVVTGPRSPNAGQTLRMTFDTALSGSGIPAASISSAVATRCLPAHRSLWPRRRRSSTRAIRTSPASLCPPPCDLTTKVVREKQTGRNVVAYLPATDDPDPNPSEKPWVVIGAHYDHLGHGDARQLARVEGRGRADASRRRRQRVGHRGGDRDRRSAREAADARATSCSRCGRAKRSGWSARTRS